MLSQKQVKKAIDVQISDEELAIVTDSLNNLLTIVISNIKKVEERKRVKPVEDLNEFVSMIFRNMVNIPQGFRRKIFMAFNFILKKVLIAVNNY